LRPQCRDSTGEARPGARPRSAPPRAARRHATLQAKQCHPQFDQMIEPVADAIAAPATKLFLAERHPELTQITQLVEQQRARLLPAREHPSDLAMRQAEIQRARHITYVIPHSMLTRGCAASCCPEMGRGGGKGIRLTPAHRPPPKARRAGASSERFPACRRLHMDKAGRRAAKSDATGASRWRVPLAFAAMFEISGEDGIYRQRARCPKTGGERDSLISAKISLIA
jgi:hypothetical protein